MSMGSAEQIPRISFDEYLRLEELNTSKHEWLDGIVYMMAGGTFEYGRVVDNMLVTLRQHLHGRPCQPYSGNFLVRTPSGLGAYPDIMVFCDAIQGDAADPRRAATNPTVLVEVLSDSTEEYDRGEKFSNEEEYRLVSGRVEARYDDAAFEKEIELLNELLAGYQKRHSH